MPQKAKPVRSHFGSSGTSSYNEFAYSTIVHVMSLIASLVSAKQPIQSLLTRLIADSVPEQTESLAVSRKRAHDELYADWNTGTPYGRLCDELVIRCSKSGKQFSTPYVNPFAWLFIASQRSEAFFKVMCGVAALHRLARISFYTDGVESRNDKSPNKGGKFQAIYWRFVDLPRWLMSRQPFRWFRFCYVGEQDLADTGITMSNVMRHVMNTFWGPEGEFNFKTTGVRLCNGTKMLQLFAEFSFIPQDERAQKAVFCIKGASGTRPCHSCDNCTGRVPWFVDPSGDLVHVHSADVHTFRRATVAQSKANQDYILQLATHGRKRDLEEAEQHLGFVYEVDGLLWDLVFGAASFLRFPHSLFWDWVHCWVSSGGIGQWHLNAFLFKIMAVLDMTAEELDVFAVSCKLPKGVPNLQRHFFLHRIRENSHFRGFASEMLAAIDVVGMLVQNLELEKVDELAQHVECFKQLHITIAALKRGGETDLPIAARGTERHHQLFRILYPDLCIPKLHYCWEVIQSWRYWETLANCFSAEAEHQEPKRVFQFAYNDPCRTALAYGVYSMLDGIMNDDVYKPMHLAGDVKSEMTPIHVEGIGAVMVTGTSKALRHVLGSFHAKDLVYWMEDSIVKVAFVVSFLRARSQREEHYIALVRLCVHVGEKLFECTGEHVLLNMAFMQRSPIPYRQAAGNRIEPLIVPS